MDGRFTRGARPDLAAGHPERATDGSRVNGWVCQTIGSTRGVSARPRDRGQARSRSLLAVTSPSSTCARSAGARRHRPREPAPPAMCSLLAYAQNGGEMDRGGGARAKARGERGKRRGAQGNPQVSTQPDATQVTSCGSEPRYRGSNPCLPATLRTLPTRARRAASAPRNPCRREHPHATVVLSGLQVHLPQQGWVARMGMQRIVIGMNMAVKHQGLVLVDGLLEPVEGSVHLSEA